MTVYGNFRSESPSIDSMHTICGEHRRLLQSTDFMRDLLHRLYRLRGLSGMSVDERDSYLGWQMELENWFDGLQKLGEQLSKDYADQQRLAGVCLWMDTERNAEKND